MFHKDVEKANYVQVQVERSTLVHFIWVHNHYS